MSHSTVSTGFCSLSKNSAPSRVSTAISRSFRRTILLVWARIAVTSEAIKFCPSERPTISGLSFLTANTLSGQSAQIIPRA